jgi:hypothetical protein
MDKKIDKSQYYIHIIFEALAVFIVVPIIIIFLINNWKIINIFYKIFFIIFVSLTLLIDGFLLIKWFNPKIII